MNSVSTIQLEEQNDFVFIKPLSIALIGPSEPRRRAVSSTLAEYPGIDVREFSSYPTAVDTVSRLLARQFDIIIVDSDSDPKVALDLVESICGETGVTVIVFTEEADPDLMARCKRAGVRDYLVLPVRQSTIDKVFARARIGLLSDAQPASKPGPQAIAVPKTDAWRNNPLPVCVSVHMNDEDLRQASRGNSAAPDPEPAAASRGEAFDHEFNDVSSSPLSSSALCPGGVIVEEIRYAPETKPPAAREDNEDSLQKPRALGSGYIGQSAAASKWATFLSGAAAAPAIANPVVAPTRDIVEPVRKTPTIEADPEIDFLSFHSDLADLGDADPNQKKWVRVGAASFAVLVLLLFVGPRLLTPAKHPLAGQSAQMHPVANVSEPAAKIAKPSPLTTLAKGRPSAVAPTRQILFAQPATNVEEAISPKADSKTTFATHETALAAQGTTGASPQVDSTLMTDQLASAPRIPQDVKAPRKQEAPPAAGLDAANAAMGSGAGAVNAVFSGQARPTVRYVPPPPVVIPVKVAGGLLIHKTLPVYPPYAWNHYISGKVVLEAVVSETGSVESLKVVSGPKLFEQAALDAVKTWRYKPYTVNDKPARMLTTVTLIFDPYRK
jgi:TonB family protein